jgi:hypothetical protein
MVKEKIAPRNYTIKFLTSEYNTEFYQCQLRFKVVDGVPLWDILDALRHTDQVKLRKAWQAQGVQVFVQRGYMLGNVGESQYNSYLEKLGKELDQRGNNEL